MSSLVPAAGKTIAVHAEVLHPRQPGRAAVGVGVHDDLGAAAQHLVGDRVHVADDDVGLVARPRRSASAPPSTPIRTGRYSRM